MTIGQGRRSFREIIKIGGPALAILIAGFAVAIQFVEPAPDGRIGIAGGSPGGAYAAFAERYSELLGRTGVELTVRETSGSIENLRLLQDPASGIQVALVQGGTGQPAKMPGLMSLASLYFEPLWVFHRGARPFRRLSDLHGRRIAIGAKGSGTRSLALQLLADRGVADDATLSPLGGADAATALRRGEIDAAIMVAAPRAAYVRGLLGAEGVHLMDLERAEALARRHRFLSRIHLPMGVIDLSNNVPPSDIAMLVPTATLVARDDLHPALVELILREATRVHRDGGLLETPGAFPSALHLDFPIGEHARRYMEQGPGFLQRFLPFWVANFLDRTKVMLLPLFRILPPTYRWRMRSRILRSYADLARLEQALGARKPGDDTASFAAELDRIENAVRDIHLPPGYLDAVYTLRVHVGLVRERLASESSV